MMRTGPFGRRDAQQVHKSLADQVGFVVYWAKVRLISFYPDRDKS